MAFSGEPSSAASMSDSARTKSTSASAMVQRSVAGGLTATRLKSGKTIVSSRTRSVAPQSPGPSIGGIDGATASPELNRARQAEGDRSTLGTGGSADIRGGAVGTTVAAAAGGAEGAAFGSGGTMPAAAENGRGRGSGVCAPTPLQASTTRMQPPITLTRGPSGNIAAL